MTDLSRTTSTASSQRSNSSQNVTNAALAGASLAFGRPAANGRAQDLKSNGALAAAASAGGHSNSSSPTRSIARTTTDESIQSVKSISSLARDVTTGAPNLALPSPPARGLSVSPSQQAASLASARAPALSVKPIQGNKTASERVAATKTPAVPPKPRRLSSYTRSTDRSEDDKPTDDTPIAPTTSLVSIFEQKSGSPQSTTSKPVPFVAKPNNELPLKSPKPVRAASGITTMIQMEQAKAQSSSPAPTNSASQVAHREAENIRAQPPVKPATLASTTAVSPKPPMPPPRRQDTTAGAENTYLERIRSENAPRGRSQPPPAPPLRNNAPEPIPIDRTTTNKSYTSVTSVTSPSDTLSPGSASNKSMHAQWNYLHPKKLAPNMTGEQLADAMVAGSLASSRQTSPTRSNTMDQPPPLPHRRAKHHTFSLSRTPSPAKAAGLRKTLRQAQSDTDDEEHAEERLYPYSKHKVQKRLGKHPNKHHEGDRKRWREEVTERERKRYEGVWAANKGLYVSYTAEERRLLDREPDGQQARDVRDAVAEQVSNIVVRDVWSRSRLSETVLETVWDLVDNERVGRLSKEEFVVGLWLIDGRLKGKKLPVKVSDSVWSSVKAMGNIKVRRVL